MTPRSKLYALAGVLALALVGAFVGSTVGSPPPDTGGRTELTRAPVRTIGPGELERISARELGEATTRKPKKAANVSYYASEETFTVAPSTADLRQIVCPAKRQPVTGGVFAPNPGLAITNSSRLQPREGATLPGAWYEEVTNLTSVPLTWKATVTCVGK